MGDLYLANVVVGFVFVLRDYAQREIGHKVLLATLFAGIATISWWTPPLPSPASPPSCCRKWPTGRSIPSPSARCKSRILISSLVAVPLDTLAFQYLAGYLTPAAFTTEVLSKALGVAIVWYLLKLRMDRTPAPVH